MSYTHEQLAVVISDILKADPGPEGGKAEKGGCTQDACPVDEG